MDRNKEKHFGDNNNLSKYGKVKKKVRNVWGISNSTRWLFLRIDADDLWEIKLDHYWSLCSLDHEKQLRSQYVVQQAVENHGRFLNRKLT